jgi:hypothetical protein
MTLQGAGLFHMAMGAVLGLAAWGRTQEKLNGTSSNNVPEVPTASVAPRQVQVVAEPVVSVNGKKAPPPAHEPEI